MSAGLRAALARSRLPVRAGDIGTRARLAIAWALELESATPAKVRFVDAPQDVTSLPRDDELFIWIGEPLRDPSSLAEALDALDAPARYRRLQNPEDFAAAVTAAAAARVLLGAALDRAPRQLALAAGKFQKPFLPGVPAHFNWSHTRQGVAVALAGVEVGIDIEAVRPMPDQEQVANLALAPPVSRLIGVTADEAERGALFFRHWTLAEAFVKATGLGVSQNLRSFEFTLRGEPRLTCVSDDFAPCERWQFGLAQA